MRTRAAAGARLAVRIATVLAGLSGGLAADPSDVSHAENTSACAGAGETIAITAAAPSGAILADGRTMRFADVLIGAEGQLEIARLAGSAGTFLPARWASGTDRHGRVPGDIVLKDTTQSVRDGLLSRGLALVDPAVMSGACLASLFAAEEQAETSRSGLWAQADTVLAADSPDLSRHLGRYVLVRGKVAGVGETRETIYLNFGADWDTDFTVLVRRADAGSWADDLASLAGETVRIRGVLQAWNGGLIEVEHPAQIERLAGSAPPR